MKKLCGLSLSLTVVVVALACANARAQQVADPNFKPPIAKPAYPSGRGPSVMIDGGHSNFHTVDGRYQPFAELLRRDGYRVSGSNTPFTKEVLRSVKVLVIANALNKRNETDWSLPTPSAFTDEEIAVVSDWVRRGGSLFLIADHMPMPGAAEKLAAAFGVRMNNGFALIENSQGGNLTFRRGDGALAEHPITKGRTTAEKIDSVTTFTGSAFQADKGAQPLLVFGADVVSLMPKVAWQFTPETPRVAVKGWLQGAALKHGKGRVVVFGEAAMFSAQLAGAQRTPIGMNSPAAPQNAQLLLNVLHWLSGLL